MAGRDFNFARPFSLNPGQEDPRQPTAPGSVDEFQPSYMADNVEEFTKPTLLSRDEFFHQRDDVDFNARPMLQPAIDYSDRPMLVPATNYAPPPVDPKLQRDFDDLDNMMQQDIDTLAASQGASPFRLGAPRADSRGGYAQPESTAVPGKFMPPEENVTDQDFALKLQVLVDKVKEYQTRLRDLKGKNLDLTKDNYEKGDEIKNLKEEKELLEKEMEAFGIDVTDKSMANLKYVGKRDFDAEEDRRRNDMRRELMMGIALVDEVGDLGGRNTAGSTWVQKLEKALLKVLSKFVVLKSDVRHIEAIYDKSISAYFNFYKHLVNASILIFVVYGYLLVNHILVNEKGYTEVCAGNLCWLYYHSFLSSEAFAYALSLAIFILITLSYGLVKWIRVDYYKTRSEIYGGKDAKLKKFAAIIFNPWDWNIDEDTEAADQTVNLSNQLTTAITDELRLQEASRRSKAQKTALFIRKVVGLLINVLFVIVGFICIFLLVISESQFKSLFSGSSASIVGEFIPKIGVSMVNVIVPALTMKITIIEKWDDPAVLTKTRILRLYIGKILNVCLYAILNIELAANYTFFGSDLGIQFEDDNFECREDQAGMNLVLLVLSEAFVGKFAALSWPLFDYMSSKCRKTPMQKREIQTATSIINVIYFQSLIWITLPFFPYVAFLSPIFLYIDFKFQYWRLRKLQNKPQEMTQASDMSIFIMQFYNLTIILLCCYLFFLFQVEMYHGTYGSSEDNCGPFDNNVSWMDKMVETFNQSTIIQFIWDSLANYSLWAWSLVLLFLVKNAFKSNYKKVAKSYIKDKEAETSHVINDLQRGNARLRQQLKFHKKLGTEVQS